mmetsp:Transcript_11639/g.27355  ORF Transcript_11639/g.27355 Transcript_11639/m.27355 type:complete len:306 (+) Transcript_11639:442-1359(+)
MAIVFSQATFRLVVAAPRALVLWPRPVIPREPDRAVEPWRGCIHAPSVLVVATPTCLAGRPCRFPVLEANRAIVGCGGTSHRALTLAGKATAATVVTTPRLLSKRPRVFPLVIVLVAVVANGIIRVSEVRVLHTHGAYARLALESPALALCKLQIEHAIHTLSATDDAENVARVQQVLCPRPVNLCRGTGVDRIGDRRLVAPHLWDHHWAALFLVPATPDPHFVRRPLQVGDVAIKQVGLCGRLGCLRRRLPRKSCWRGRYGCTYLRCCWRLPHKGRCGPGRQCCRHMWNLCFWWFPHERSCGAG